VIILCRALTGSCPVDAAKVFAGDAKSGLINLATILDEVDGNAWALANCVMFWTPLFHPIMVQQYSKALTNATVVAGVIANPTSSMSFLHPCL
jgi:hypothetical protein